MPLESGSIVTLDIEKAVAGGRMLARHQGQVVLVGGAIPGERVTALVTRSGKGVAYAETISVELASPDRRADLDWRCGGSMLGHVGYPRQLSLKREIIRDALGRIGRIKLADPPEIVASPERGYRMRARLHAHEGRLGFYREGTHEVCDAAATGQLLSKTGEWIAAMEETVRRCGLEGLAGVDFAENLPGTERAAHLDLRAGVETSRFAPLAEGLLGLSAQRVDRADIVRLAGTTVITDVLHAREGDPSTALRLRRDVRGFFQGNRFVLERLVRHVASLVPDGPVVDLYAGVGLFGLSLAAAGRDSITLVEGDSISGRDLLGNAEPFRGRVRVERRGVEAFLGKAGLQGETRSANESTFIADPPRTGLSKEALRGIVALRPRCLVYVSCDVPTLARDARGLLDAGYELAALSAMDMFPNTAHIETIAVFV